MVLGLQTAMAQRVVLYLAGNQVYERNISQMDSIVFVEDESTIEDDHEWVDLGLPSGTLWAKCNIGANSPEEYGDYLAWGETTGYKNGKTTFNWSTYKHCKGSSKTLIKYCYQSNYGYNGFTDILTDIEPEDDAAMVNWGSNWQIPSWAQFQELINSNYTTTEWTTLNKKNGRMVKSKINGKSIFLPAAGVRDESGLKWKDSKGAYWARSISMDYSPNACGLNISSTNSGVNLYENYSRCDGQSVRPVRKK